MHKFLSLIGLFAFLILASCETDSVENETALFSTDGNTTDPKDGKD